FVIAKYLTCLRAHIITRCGYYESSQYSQTHHLLRFYAPVTHHSNYNLLTSIIAPFWTQLT
ncbi:TPA: hypothetical protein ACN976_003663, partial [Vibrio campbellii]